MKLLCIETNEQNGTKCLLKGPTVVWNSVYEHKITWQFMLWHSHIRTIAVGYDACKRPHEDNGMSIKWIFCKTFDQCYLQNSVRTPSNGLFSVQLKTVP